MTQAQEEYVDAAFYERVQVSGEMQVGISQQVLVDSAHGLAGVAAAVDEADGRIGMMNEEADQFSPGVAGAADNAYPYPAGCFAGSSR